MTGRVFTSIFTRGVLRASRLSPAVPLLLAVSLLAACAGYDAKEVDTAGYKARAVVQTQGPVTISAAVPDAGETRELTGIDLYDQGIQPIWLEVVNDTDHPMRVAHWSIDKDYYSPIEVAYMNRSGLSDEGEADMQRWFYETRMVRFIPAGETRSGFVYTHLVKGTKGFNLDVYSNKEDFNFTFFVDVPGFTADYKTVDFENLYEEKIILRADPDDVLGLYKIISDLAICCSMDKKGIREGEPFNVVFIGTGLAVRRAMLRAGWQETAADDPTTVRARQHYYRGRPPDATFHKYRPDGGERKELRLWLAPVRVGEDWGWMAQVSNDVHAAGGKSDYTNFHVDPDIDAARRYTSQKFWYTQAVARVGFVGGAGAASPEKPRQNFFGEDYFSDGLRSVLWLSETPVAMDDTIIENLLELEIR